MKKVETYKKLNNLVYLTNCYLQEGIRERGYNNLVVSHGVILELLFQNEGKLTMKQISQGINKTKSTVTQLVDKLIKLGLVTKVQSHLDKRYTFVLLTEKANEIKDDLSTINRGLINKLYEDFTEEELTSLDGLLRKLTENMIY